MLKIVEDTFREMNERVVYCHFKSNEHLEKSVNGKTDFDLLIQKESASEFESLLLEKGFNFKP